MKVCITRQSCISFCGMTIEETAESRGISTRTVNREITKARAMLAEWLDVSGERV